MVFWIMTVQPKRKSSTCRKENAQRRSIRAIFFKKKSESLQNIIKDKKFLTVHEIYISELVIELFRQLRRISPFGHMEDHFVPYEVNKRRKTKNLLPVTIDRTQLKKRCLENDVIKTYNWLNSCDLMPQKVESLTNEQVKTHLCQIIELFIPNNKKLRIISRHKTKLVLNVSFINWLQAIKRSELRGSFKMSLLVLLGEDIRRADQLLLRPFCLYSLLLM